MPESSRSVGPTREQFALLVEALRATRDGDDERADLILAGLTLDLADSRCDGCGEPLNDVDLRDAVAARRAGGFGFCSTCLVREPWRP